MVKDKRLARCQDPCLKLLDRNYNYDFRKSEPETQRRTAAENQRLQDRKKETVTRLCDSSQGFRDFWIGSKVSKTHDFLGTIRHPYITFRFLSRVSLNKNFQIDTQKTCNLLPDAEWQNHEIQTFVNPNRNHVFLKHNMRHFVEYNNSSEVQFLMLWKFDHYIMLYVDPSKLQFGCGNSWWPPASW